MSAQNKHTILTIDDDETVLMQVEQALKNGGYTPVCAAGGQAGLSQAVTQSPDLILLDRRMPDMDGDETLTRLKANDVLENIPVIMLTGDNSIADVSSSLELGAIDYIVKPFDSDNLIMRIKAALIRHERAKNG